MNKITRISLTLIAIFFFNTFAFGDYKERMKARLPQIISAKSAGTIGEGVDGLLHLRVESDEATTDLINAENADRKEFISAMAEKRSESPEVVARNLSDAMKARDKEGFWYQNSSGDWVQK